MWLIIHGQFFLGIELTILQHWLNTALMTSDNRSFIEPRMAKTRKQTRVSDYSFLKFVSCSWFTTVGAKWKHAAIFPLCRTNQISNNTGNGICYWPKNNRLNQESVIWGVMTLTIIHITDMLRETFNWFLKLYMKTNKSKGFNWLFNLLHSCSNVRDVVGTEMHHPIVICLQYTASGPFYQHGLTLIQTWISNYIHYKIWGEITYPFLNFKLPLKGDTCVDIHYSIIWKKKLSKVTEIDKNTKDWFGIHVYVLSMRYACFGYWEYVSYRRNDLYFSTMHPF